LEDKLASYVQLARDAILALIHNEHAVVWLEVEAKLAGRPAGGLSDGINPHHLTRAKQGLLAAGTIGEVTAQTRGGRIVTVLGLTNRYRRQRAFEIAAQRKRVLFARYLGWGTATQERPNLIGAAGERVTHASLLAAASHGYRLVRPEGGDVPNLFGQPVPIGPLDSIAHVQIIDDVGRPKENVTLPIEVKNIRHWVYPDSSELYELLAKAALLQMANPGVSFMPVLVCRKVHYTTFRMAKDLGFFVAQARAQFVLPYAEVTPDHAEELRRELGFADLVLSQEAHRPLVALFRTTIPQVAEEKAKTFAASAEMLARFSQFLRLDDTRLRGETLATREEIMNELRDEARTLSWVQGGW